MSDQCRPTHAKPLFVLTGFVSLLASQFGEFERTSWRWLTSLWISGFHVSPADTAMLARFAFSLSFGSGARVFATDCDPFCALQACLRWPLGPSGLRSTSSFPQRVTSPSYLPSRTSTTMSCGWLRRTSFGSPEHTRRGSQALRPPCRRPTSSLPQRVQHHHFDPREVARLTWLAQRAWKA